MEAIMNWHKFFGAFNLRYADLRDANLRYADLRDANLRDANLRDANLRDANLSYANLRYANLSDANLRDADLSYANLRYADLRYANLSYANLRYANLSDANLSYANLRYANLSDANLRYADLRDANLSGVKGLLCPIEWFQQLESTPDGIIVYKAIGKSTPNDSEKWGNTHRSCESMPHHRLCLRCEFRYPQLGRAKLQGPRLRDLEVSNPAIVACVCGSSV
jgi:uncharacterized protein YjbI with pentapeptide repeats